MKIVVVGLLHKQERIVEASCPEGVELRFMSTDQSVLQWAKAAKHADACILVAGFISHKRSAAVQATGVRMVTHYGGLTKLKELIIEIAKEPAR